MGALKADSRLPCIRTDLFLAQVRLPDGSYRAKMAFQRRPGYLLHVYVHNVPRTLGPPRVVHVSMFGVACDDGSELHEKKKVS